jgi:hypothetical protein
MIYLGEHVYERKNKIPLDRNHYRNYSRNSDILPVDNVQDYSTF